MKVLKFGCKRSEFIISPANYKEITADHTKLQWFVMCRFYEEDREKPFVFKKKVFKTLSLKDKKKSIPIILAEMESALDVRDYNPRTKQYMFSQEGLHRDMYFITALQEALKLRVISEGYRRSIKSYIRKVEKSAKKLKLDYLKIHEVELSHVKKLLNDCAVSNCDYNRTKKNLSPLFADLVDESCIKVNPCTNLKSRSHISSIKKIFTDKELKKVFEHIKETKPNFVNYFQVFLMSGSRNTELLQLQKKHVNLDKREFVILIKKGSLYQWETRPIYHLAVPFWEDQLNLCKSDDDYLFGANFLPAKRSKGKDSVYHFWKRNIMVPLGIDVTIYSLKHYFLDKLDEANHNAGSAAGQRNKEITALYTVGKKKRELEYLKNIPIQNPSLDLENSHL